jgi:long-chain acyl-CoA synthetase
MNLAHQLLEMPLRRFPERTAIISARGNMTFGELEDEVERIAKGLRGLGIGIGDRVGFMMNNRPEVISLYFAIVRIGAIAVAVNVMLREAELVYLLNDADVVAIVCEDAVADRALQAQASVTSLRHVIVTGDSGGGGLALSDLPSNGHGGVASLSPDAPAMMVYTSGTTGVPKGVLMSHSWVDYVCAAWNSVFKTSHQDRSLVTSPFFYVIGSVIEVLSPFRVGSSVVLIERFKPRDALEIITRHRPTITCMVPTAVQQILSVYDPSRDDVTSMRAFFVAGDLVTPELSRRVKETLGWQVRQIYGLTEAHMLAVDAVGYAPEEGWLGPPGGNTEIRLVDDDGRDVESGEVGEIVSRGDTIAGPYWKRPDETAEAWREGWFHTGDLGVHGPTGRLKVVGRKKEMIITGGANIYPAEVERLMMEHPAVEQVVVVSVEDEMYGQVPWGLVVLRHGVEVVPEELISWCRDHMAVFKCPRRIVIVSELPLTASGKVKRAEVREWLSARLSCDGLD